MYVKRMIGKARYAVAVVAAMCGFVCSGGQDEPEVTCDSLKVAFATAGEDRGRVVRVETAKGAQLGSLLATVPLFKIKLCRADDFTNTCEVTADSMGKFSTERADGGLRLIFDGGTGALERAVCTVKPDGGKLRWRIMALPRAGWAVEETSYPRIALAEYIGLHGGDDAIVSGRNKCGIVRNPGDPKRKYWWSWRADGKQPGYLTAQFATYYDENAGFYSAAEDGAGYTKRLEFQRQYNDAFLCQWTHIDFDEGRFELPYDVVTAGFDAAPGRPVEWYDAADLYKEWALKQSWCRKRLVDRDDLPAWVKDAPMVQIFSGRRWFDDPAKVRTWMKDVFRPEFPDVPVLAGLIGWEKNDPWISDYFPLYPDDATCTETFRTLQKFGAHPWPWPSGHFHNLTYDKQPDGTFRVDARETFQREFVSHAILDRDGKPHTRKSSWLKGGENACLCPGDKWVRDWWTTNIAVRLAKSGAEMIQWDQEHGGEVPPCWSRNHGHKPGDGAWKTAAIREQYRQVRDAMAPYVPGGKPMLSTEEPNETLNDLYSIEDFRNCRFEVPPDGCEWAGVYTYLYHEFVVPFQVGLNKGSRAWLAFCLADGQAPSFGVDVRMASSGPMLLNGGFENVERDGSFEGWIFPKNHAMDTAEKHSGARSLRMDGRGGKKRQVSQGIPVEDAVFKPGKRFRISAWVKTGKAAKGNNICTIVLGREQKAHASVSIAFPKPEEGWKRVSGELTYPKTDEALSLYNMINIGADGLAWVDDFMVEEVLPDGTTKELVATGRSHWQDYLRKWIALYRGEGRPFLAYGKRIRPPHLICRQTVYKGSFREIKTVGGQPAVFHAAYEAADGRRALVLANATASYQRVAYDWNGKRHRFWLKPDEFQLVPLD